MYDATLRARDVFFRGFPFDEIRGTVRYGEEILVSDLLMDNGRATTLGAPDLIVRGTLPINLAIKGESEPRPDKPMDFTVYSDGLQMSLLDPILPTFNDLTGILKANFRVGGTPKKPSFTGTMGIEGSSFLFVPNNMYYKLDGTFKPSGERIQSLGVGDLYRIYLRAQREQAAYHAAWIDSDFAAPWEGWGDPHYMRALFDYGYAQAVNGQVWHSEPP